MSETVQTNVMISGDPSAPNLTEYVVLRSPGTGPDDMWTMARGAVRAPNADAAIRKACGGEPGTYVAIPTRSFAPRKVDLQTETKVVLS